MIFGSGTFKMELVKILGIVCLVTLLVMPAYGAVYSKKPSEKIYELNYKGELVGKRPTQYGNFELTVHNSKDDKIYRFDTDITEEQYNKLVIGKDYSYRMMFLPLGNKNALITEI